MPEAIKTIQAASETTEAVRQCLQPSENARSDKDKSEKHL